MKTIPLTRRAVALIDDEDLEIISRYTWHLNKGGYAVSNTKPSFYMHRLVNKTPFGVDTDHINCNKLDNRRSNLRNCTPSQNLHNRPAQRNNSLGLKGVIHLPNKPHHKRRKQFLAQIKANGVYRRIGYYSTAEEAHAAYIETSKQLIGEFHRTTSTQ